MTKVSRILMIAAAAAAFCSCAKQHVDTASDAAKREFDAWVAVKYPDAVPAGRGIYIISDTPGDGQAINPVSDRFAFVNYAWKDLEGNISATSDAGLAKQTGKYKPSDFYGSATWDLSSGSLFAGIYDAIKDMRVGGTREFISPIWLNNYSDYPTEEQFLKKFNAEDCKPSAIFKVTLLGMTADIVRYQIDSLERYIPREFGSKVDSSFLGYYYIRTAPPSDDLSLKDSTVYINYTGRLLNGQVFDTTVEDTAKLYNIYDSSKTYGPQRVSMGDSVDKLTLGSSSSSSGTPTTARTAAGLIRGFAYTVFNMKHHEKGSAVFVSSYGYSATGSGTKIPAYAPLRFDIELVDKPAD